MKNAVLFLAHFINDSVIEKFIKLKNELPDTCDLFWAFHSDNYGDTNKIEDIGGKIFCFSLENLNSLGYVYINRLYGRENRIMEYFYNTHPDYDYYWCIEYDVVFSGSWNSLINSFDKSDSDFISSHVELRNSNNEYWDWWGHINYANTANTKCIDIKSFNPIYRISNRALAFLDTFLKDGNDGFYELIMVTPLYNNGFTIEDFGGTGDFVKKDNRNRFYVQGSGVNNGTMRWKPLFLKEEIETLGTRDKLFHPLKE